MDNYIQSTKQTFCRSSSIHSKNAFQKRKVVQWLRLGAPIAGGPGSTTDRGSRSHSPQLRPGAVK